MLERNLNTRILRALKGHHPFRVENACLAGTPDINYSCGWIESKILNRWPKKGNVVRVPHFSPQQRLWHLQRSLAAGVSYIIIQIERDVLLLRGYDAAHFLGKVPELELRELALGHWQGTICPEELQALLVNE